MASQRKRFTTEVVAYFGRNDSSNEEEELAGETFTDFIGVVVSDMDSEGVSGDRREGCKSNELVSGNDSSEQEDETDTSMLPGAEAESISHVDDLPLQDDVRDNVALNQCVNPYNSSNTSKSSDGSISDSSFRAQNVTSHHLSTSEFSNSESESSEESANDSESTQQPSSARQHSRRRTGPIRGHSIRSRVHLRGRGRSYCTSTRGTRAARGKYRRQTRRASYKDFIPKEAKPISEEDTDFLEWNEFMPLRDPGPHLLESQVTELELLRLFISDDMLEKFIVATNAYAEAQKEAKQAMYTRFKRTPLTKEELIRYIGVLLLLSVNSVRNFRKAWERKSSQVRITTVNKSYVQVCI